MIWHCSYALSKELRRSAVYIYICIYVYVYKYIYIYIDMVIYIYIYMKFSIWVPGSPDTWRTAMLGAPALEPLGRVTSAR